MWQRVVAAMMAGGRSRRMGTDKALLPLRPGEPPLAQVVLDRLRAVTPDVFVVASGRPAYGAFGAPVVPDRFPDTGVLGGIATAIAHADGARCLVVACDMPFLNVALLRWMAAQPADCDVLIPRLPGESRQGGRLVYQTLHALYGPACLPAIERRLAAGDRRAFSFLADVVVREIGLEAIRAIDPDLRSFFNANTPEEAAEARRLLGAPRAVGAAARAAPTHGSVGSRLRCSAALGRSGAASSTILGRLARKGGEDGRWCWANAGRERRRGAVPAGHVGQPAAGLAALPRSAGGAVAEGDRADLLRAVRRLAD